MNRKTQKPIKVSFYPLPQCVAFAHCCSLMNDWLDSSFCSISVSLSRFPAGPFPPSLTLWSWPPCSGADRQIGFLCHMLTPSMSATGASGPIQSILPGSLRSHEKWHIGLHFLDGTFHSVAGVPWFGTSVACAACFVPILRPDVSNEHANFLFRVSGTFFSSSARTVLLLLRPFSTSCPFCSKCVDRCLQEINPHTSHAPIHHSTVVVCSLPPGQC